MWLCLWACSGQPAPTDPARPPSPTDLPAKVAAELPVTLPAAVIEASPSRPSAQATGATTGSLQVTALVAPGAAAPQLFMELYRGPEPGQWTATTAAHPRPRRAVALDIPDADSETWLIRVDSRPPAKGPYSIALHHPGRAPAARLDAAAADAFEGDDSWFQATPLRLGEAQPHTMGDSANPRGDEDWFVITLLAKSP